MNLINSFFTEAAAVFRDIAKVFESTPKDPHRWAETPPKWWHSGAKPVEVPDTSEQVQGKEGGFAVGFDGSLIYSTGQTAAEIAGWKDVQAGGEVTEQDYGEMLAYVPKLTNVTLAKQIKPLWRQGKKYKDIAVLVCVSEQYVKFYCACFERAKKASNARQVDL